jgi:hypothetical protein
MESNYRINLQKIVDNNKKLMNEKLQIYFIHSNNEMIELLQKNNKKYDYVFLSPISSFYFHEYQETYNFQYRFTFLYSIFDYLTKENNYNARSYTLLRDAVGPLWLVMNEHIE